MPEDVGEDTVAAGTRRSGVEGSDVASLDAFRERQRTDIASALIELVASGGLAAVNVSDASQNEPAASAAFHDTSTDYQRISRYVTTSA